MPDLENKKRKPIPQCFPAVICNKSSPAVHSIVLLPASVLVRPTNNRTYKCTYEIETTAMLTGAAHARRTLKPGPHAAGLAARLVEPWHSVFPSRSSAFASARPAVAQSSVRRQSPGYSAHDNRCCKYGNKSSTPPRRFLLCLSRHQLSPRATSFLGPFLPSRLEGSPRVQQALNKSRRKQNKKDSGAGSFRLGGQDCN